MAFIDHWIKDLRILPPSDYQNGIPNEIIIIDWFIQKEDESTWLSIGENGKINSSHFFCSKCKKWKFLNASIANSKRHIDNHKKKDHPNIGESLSKHYQGITHMDSESINKYIMKQIKCFVLLNGYPFSTIEDAFLKTICSNLPSREQFSKEVESISNMVEEKLEKAYYRCSSLLDAGTIDARACRMQER